MFWYHKKSLVAAGQQTLDIFEYLEESKKLYIYIFIFLYSNYSSAFCSRKCDPAPDTCDFRPELVFACDPAPEFISRHHDLSCIYLQTQNWLYHLHFPTSLSASKLHWSFPWHQIIRTFNYLPWSWLKHTCKAEMIGKMTYCFLARIVRRIVRNWLTPLFSHFIGDLSLIYMTFRSKTVNCKITLTYTG